MTDSMTPQPKTDDQAECPFCVEFADVEASEFRRLFSRDEMASRIVSEDSRFALIVGIGAFSPGYLLLIPKLHVKNFGRLPAQHYAQADAWRRLSLSKLQRHFGGAVLFEHGGTSTNMAGGCIDHAHIHLVPSTADLISHMNRQMPHVSVPNLAGLPSATAGEPYVLIQQAEDMEAYFPPERLPSQYVRRLLLELDGRPEVWDWAVFPGKEHMLTTMQVLSSESKESWRPNV